MDLAGNRQSRQQQVHAPPAIAEPAATAAPARTRFANQSASALRILHTASATPFHRQLVGVLPPSHNHFRNASSYSFREARNGSSNLHHYRQPSPHLFVNRRPLQHLQLRRIHH
ncbi:hypothetical protein DEO72_LG10g1947 [Vigna unguiculata]|uniref:Uncharacterized protein n=1 Tax=Vigna unguiculata TaxID=3917 RepID=A0A4D6NAF3_VIGUN|nr:hypothetical protein DEO72_LG10g1947 [Vigna unguiculata]